MTNICIELQECKPQWAVQHGIVEAANRCGLENAKLSGDYDAKLTYVYGQVQNLSQFETLLKQACGCHMSVYAIK